MSHKQPKTSGFVWLEHSVNAFNGTNYVDRSSPEAFIASYVAFKKWKKKPEAVQLVIDYYDAILPLAEYLILHSTGSSTPVSPKNMEKFKKFYTFN